MQKGKLNGNATGWVAIIITIALAMGGWVWQVGVQHQRVDRNADDIVTTRMEIREMRRANTSLALEVARLTEAVNQLNSRLDRQASQ